jgi:hypothetical protein
MLLVATDFEFFVVTRYEQHYVVFDDYNAVLLFTTSLYRKSTISSLPQPPIILINTAVFSAKSTACRMCCSTPFQSDHERVLGLVNLPRILAMVYTRSNNHPSTSTGTPIGCCVSTFSQTERRPGCLVCCLPTAVLKMIGLETETTPEDHGYCGEVQADFSLFLSHQWLFGPPPSCVKRSTSPRMQ